MTEQLRLSKRMSELGLCSRREADEWIARGWVRVDGVVVSELGSKVFPHQRVTVERQASAQQSKRVTVLINKPMGYVSGQAEDGYTPAIALIKADAVDFVKFGIEQAGGILRASRMLATAEAAGIPVVIGHGFGLDPSTLAEIMIAASSRNVLPGLECVGPLKVQDTVATTRLDISAGSIPLPDGPGLGITLDDAKLEQYRM